MMKLLDPESSGLQSCLGWKQRLWFFGGVSQKTIYSQALGGNL